MTVRVPIVDRRSSQAPTAPDPGAGLNEEAVSHTSSQPPEPPRAAAVADSFPEDGRLAAAIAERDDWRDRALRATAELENLRKLVDQRVDAEVFRRGRDQLDRWLELGDALDRARDLAANAPSEWSSGLDELGRLFDDLMRRAGASRIEVGATFDPEWHEALCAVPGSGNPDGAVVEVVRAGWKLGDRLLRPAGVTVARGAG